MSVFLQRTLDIIFGIISAGLMGAYGLLTRQFRDSKKERMNVPFGLRALLRDRIIQKYHDSVEHGFCSVNDRQTIDELLTAYVNLGGNGTIPSLVEKLKALPTEPTKTQEDHDHANH